MLVDRILNFFFLFAPYGAAVGILFSFALVILKIGIEGGSE